MTCSTASARLAKKHAAECLKALELQVARLESALTAWQTTLAIERSRPIAIPNPLAVN